MHNTPMNDWQTAVFVVLQLLSGLYLALLIKKHILQDIIDAGLEADKGRTDLWKFW